MNKRTFLSGIIISTIFVFAGCSSSKAAISFSKAANNVNYEAKIDGVSDLVEMEEKSDLIVVAKRLEESEPVIKRSDGYIVSFYTFSKVRIDAIFSDGTGKIKTGDVVRVLENEVYDEESGKSLHIGGYCMMEEGKKYLLFLNKAPQDMDYYCSVGVNYGTISLEDDGRDERVISEDGTKYKDLTEDIKDIWGEAKNKYIGK